MASRSLFSIVLVLLISFGIGPRLRADQSEIARKRFQDTKALADRGDAEAQLRLASYYINGTGVALDLAKAAKWHRKAAEQGLAAAQYQLARDYAQGKGVKEDKFEAAEWYQKAAEQDLLEAQIAMGLCFLYGEGVDTSGSEALLWFQKAADRGSPQAQYLIGKCYIEGIGVPKDISDGVPWIWRSAEAGFPQAQNYYGSLCEKGLGVEKNYFQAYKWFSLAAAKDDSHAPDIRVSIAKVESLMSKEDVAAAQRAAHQFKPRLTVGNMSSNETNSPSSVSAPGDASRPTPPVSGAGDASRQTGLIIVNANDDEAEVFADGAFVGNSPAKLSLKEGPHTVEVKKNGFKTYSREVAVTVGSELNLKLTLQKE